MFYTEIILCLVLTVILVYLSTFDLDTIEFVLLVLCFLAIIWILKTPNDRTKTTREMFQDTLGWTKFNVSAYQELAELPVKVKDLIQPPIEDMVNNSTKTDENSEIDNLENIDKDRYVDEEDTYVGQIEMVMERDAFGKETPRQKLVIQEDKFNAMKLEYKKLDAMLAKLRDGNKELYAKLIPKIVQEEQ